MKNQIVLIVDFGGQYSRLIARRVREFNIYCEIYPYKKALKKAKELSPAGIIFSGGPNSVYAENAPKIESEIYALGIPMLGICYGAQLMAQDLGGVVTTNLKEYGQTDTEFDLDCPLFKDIPKEGITWMSHTDYIKELPVGFKAVASTRDCPSAALENADKKLYAVQFHPEVAHTQNGNIMLKNFLFEICGCAGDWSMDDYVETVTEEIRDKVGEKKVLLALSGGVDSSVLAALLSKAIGNQLTCIFVDHGLMRKNEGNEVEAAFKEWDINFVRINAEDRFLTRLAGVSDPETKRKIIGEEFIRVFEQEAGKMGHFDFLAQGTIYPDIIESGVGDAAVIKSHHNVGGLPDKVDFDELLEPLQLLFKDEVRKLGKKLGLADYLVNRQPFPGPGLAVRVIGEITKAKLDILREADYIFREEVAAAGLDREISQYFAVLTSMRSVGVMGDERTYDYTVALRAVTTSDFMTADFARIPYEALSKASGRIVNGVKGINRVVYDITTKPPATIEWE